MLVIAEVSKHDHDYGGLTEGMKAKRKTER